MKKKALTKHKAPAFSSIQDIQVLVEQSVHSKDHIDKTLFHCRNNPHELSRPANNKPCKHDFEMWDVGEKTCFVLA